MLIIEYNTESINSRKCLKYHQAQIFEFDLIFRMLQILKIDGNVKLVLWCFYFGKIFQNLLKMTVWLIFDNIRLVIST